MNWIDRLYDVKPSTWARRGAELFVLAGIVLVFAACAELGLTKEDGLEAGGQVLESGGQIVGGLGATTGNPILAIVGSALALGGAWMRRKAKGEEPEAPSETPPESPAPANAPAA